MALCSVRRSARHFSARLHPGLAHLLHKYGPSTFLPYSTATNPHSEEGARAEPTYSCIGPSLANLHGGGAKPPKFPKITPFCKGPPLPPYKNFPHGGHGPPSPPPPLSDGFAHVGDVIIEAEPHDHPLNLRLLTDRLRYLCASLPRNAFVALGPIKD